MSFPVIGNGCSLENCHTNLFALTDLKAIKWKKWTAESNYCIDPLEDPVLKAYSRCIQADILCVWRRSAKSQTDKPVDHLSCKKELWVFWYGDEPANLSNLLSPELKDAETGSFDVVMSYECRTLLFKALHNLIERCLVSHGYVRVGRWFVQPFDSCSSQYCSRKPHLSFQFSFFLHGESNVCASIDVRQHPPLYRLSSSQLYQMTRNNPPEIPVVLAPYGLKATLISAGARETEYVKKMLEEWRQFYVIKSDVDREEETVQKLPSSVEVVVGGVRMRYPTALVLTIGELSNSSSSLGGTDVQNSDASNNDAASSGAAEQVWSQQPTDDSTKHLNSSITLGAMRLVQRAMEDGATSGSVANNTVGEINTEPIAQSNMWLFSDSSKNACACARSKLYKEKPLSNINARAAVSTLPNKHVKVDKTSSEKTEKMTTTPRYLYHKRLNDEIDRNCVAQNLPRLGTNDKITASQKIAAVNQEAIIAKESPNLGVPSPLADAQLHSSFGGTADPMMPTLSPHPPSKCHEKDSVSNCELSSSSELQGGVRQVVDVLSNNLPNASQLSTLPASVSARTNLNLLLPSSAGSSSVNTASKLSPSKVAQSCSGHALEAVSLKRPMLAAASYEDAESETVIFNAIYDLNFSGHGTKRSRSDEFGASSVVSPGINRGDPYEFAEESSASSQQTKPSSVSHDDQDLFSPGTARDGGIRHLSDSQKFSARANSTSQAGVNTSLIREQDLRPTMHDLDNLFASDSDASDSDMPPTPPKSNRPDKNRSQTSVCNQGGSLSQVDIIYPTPPSMESHQNEQSPHQKSDGIEMMEENFKDTVNVFKPPQIASYVMPTNYLPRQLTCSAPLPQTTSIAYQLSIQFMNYQLASRHIAPSNFNSNPQPHQMENTNSLLSISGSRNTLSLYDSSLGVTGNSTGHSQMMRTPITPSTYDLQSPASNASSYLNRTLSSVDNQPTTNSQHPEANSLVTNIFLSDSILNLFKDCNFDSCPMCVCNGNIFGADNGIYLPDRSKEDQFKCTCGFSAVINRKYGVGSGLFYEDEFDITGNRVIAQTNKKQSLFAELNDTQDVKSLPPEISDSMLLQLQAQFSCLLPTALIDFNCHKKAVYAEHKKDRTDEVNVLEMKDGCDACWMALEAGLQVTDGQAVRLDELSRSTPLHKWPYLQGSHIKLPLNSHDTVRLLKSLQPLLQDALQKKRMTRLWDAVYKVDGPLNWKDFHRLAGRGLEEISKPQPIPRLIFGLERDWVSMSPFVVRHWDRFLLEPYGDRRNVLYVIVAPDSESVLSRVITFFKDLSTAYEASHLGRHQPVSTKLRDGILRVGSKNAAKVAGEPVGDWFLHIGNHHLAAKLKTYAQICRYHLGPFVAQEMTANSSDVLKQQPSVVIKQESGTHSELLQNTMSMIPGNSSLQPSLPSHDDKSTISGELPHETSQIKEPIHESDHDDSTRELPSIVVYMIDPFGFGNESSSMSRLATFGLLRCFDEFVQSLPESLQPTVHLQILPLQLIYQHEFAPDMNYLRSLALSVYTQACRLLAPAPVPSPPILTTGANATVDVEQIAKSSSIRLMCPPFILASERDTYCAITDITADRSDHSSVLFCCYCLSSDQRWLLAACTDHRGEILETVMINIEVPNGHRRKKASARKVGLRKLWEFIVGIVSKTANMWRLVIGRFGRLGHGELKGWSGLLNRKNLQRSSHLLHLYCKTCNQMGAGRGQRNGRTNDVTCSVCGVTISGEMPFIVSSCLVSFEVHPTIQVMTDSINNCDTHSTTAEDLSTPRDASCTHILVFPTSASAQANSANDHRGPVDNTDLGEDVFLPNLEDDDLGDLGSDLHDIFGMCSPDSPKHGMDHGSSSHGAQGSSSALNGGSVVGSGLENIDAQDEMGSLSQQPLAVGYYVSTAKTGVLPQWFWSSCPHKETSCPTCFRAALHIHSTSAHPDDAIVQPSASSHGAHSHPLDSHLTCDVLRYVLETYNALSWLTIDPVANDRRSCLPPHIVVMMQLYQAMDRFV